MKLIYTITFTIVFFIYHIESKAFPSTTVPHTVDSLKSLLSNENDVQHLTKIYWSLYRSSKSKDIGKATFYLDKMLDIAGNSGDKKAMGMAYLGKGTINKLQGNYSAAIDAFLEAIDLFSAVDEHQQIADGLNNIAVIFMDIDNYEYAIRFLRKARNIYVQLEDSPYQMLADINLGRCYYSKSKPDYKLSERYYREALDLNHRYGRRQNHYFNRIYNQLGLLHFEKGNYCEAERNYKRSLAFAQDMESPEESMFIAYTNISEAMMKLGKITMAEHWIQKALDLNLSSLPITKPKLLVGSYNIMARLQQCLGNHSMAIDYLDKALERADHEVINEALRETLAILGTSYRQLDSRGSRVSSDRYHQLLELHEKQDRLEKEIKEKTNFSGLHLALKKQIELSSTKHQMKRKLSAKATQELFLSIIVIFFAVLGYLLYRRKQRQYLNEQRRAALAHKGLKEVREMIT